jgi:hypothetical protein
MMYWINEHIKDLMQRKAAAAAKPVAEAA